MISAAIGSRPRNRQLAVLCGVTRPDLGLNPLEKPGDFDVLLLPNLDGKYYLNEIMAIEVKILRLRRKNRDKHPSPTGTAQAQGLLRDGFPYVGMLHLIISEPSPLEEWKPLMRARLLSAAGNAETLPGKFPVDTIGIEAAERHFGRMTKYVAGTCIGAKSIALVLDESGCQIIGRDLHNREIIPAKNPYMNLELLQRVCDLAASQTGR